MCTDGNFVFQHDPREEGLQLIKVGLQQRVEFVIVTLSTSDGKTQERRSDISGQVIERCLTRQQNVRGVAFVRPHAAVARRGERLCIVGKKFITGELVENKSIVGKITVVGPDHIVPVNIRCRSDRILFESRRLGKPHHIQPVPPPGFAEMRVA